jgi:SagB-type dehydrogenase family enzyme
VPDNRHLESAWAYHNATKHSAESVRSNRHFLDWTNQPLPFKIYATLDPAPLPREFEQTGVAALSAIAEAIAPEREAIPSLAALAQMLYFSAGITKRRPYPGGEIFFRAAACTGALYEIELYVVCGDLPDLPAGLYHFAPADFGLRTLRRGDFRGTLVQATASEPSIAHAPLIVICTATYWRNSWKYQSRTYRHFGWDNGTLLANLLAMSTALGLPAKLLCGFIDDDVNRLLDLDTTREVAFSLVPIGYTSHPAAPLPKQIAPLDLEAVPLSKKEVDYPLMREMHAVSSLHSSEEVEKWRGPAPAIAVPEPSRRIIPLQPLSEEEIPRDPIEQVILRRGSSRRFARMPITFAQLSTMLDRATRGVPADFLEPLGAQLNHLYLVAHAVDGLEPGTYFFDRERHGLEPLLPGAFRDEAGHLGLDQELPADASVCVFFLADLDAILQRYGNRGYRAVQLEAGTVGGKLYLAAYALHLGATGLTFYDDEVVKFFSPHAAGKSAVFLVALGRSAGRT